MTRGRLVLLALALAAVGRAAEGPVQAPQVARRVTFVHSTGYERSQLVAPGEWVPRACYLAMPYREGKVLRFERIDPRGVVSHAGSRVSIDGGPVRPGWITLGRRDKEIEGLSRLLAQGVRGLTVICRPETLPELPRLPRGRDIALAVTSPVDPAPLAKQTGITALNLKLAKGHNLDVLGSLPELTSLRLYCPEACDLAPLAKTRKLDWLRLTGVRNLESLPPMPSLRGLRVMTKEPLTDLRPLGRLRRLAVLHLSCKPELIDITPLARLRQLEVLSLASSGIADLTPLAGMTRLRFLDLSHCQQLTRLDPLTGLKALEELRLVKCTNVVDFSPLAALPRLRRLDLSSCEQLARLDVLARLTELRELNLGPNAHVLHLASLAGLAHMETLDLSSCKGISDLRPLAKLANLRSLSLSSCDRVTDLSPLTELPRLADVRLTRCPGITDLSPLRAAARREGSIYVDKALQPQLETLRGETDF